MYRPGTARANASSFPLPPRAQNMAMSEDDITNGASIAFEMTAFLTGYAKW